jgi:UPF0755 protein
LENPLKSILKKSFILGLILLILAAAAAAGLIWDLRNYANTSHGQGAPERVVTIPPGIGFDAVSQRLKESDIIGQPFKFKLLARWKGADNKLKAGEYHFGEAMTPLEVLETLVAGKVHLYRVTIPEGWTIDQISATVEAAGLARAQTFAVKARDPELATSLSIEGDTVEGYLFPETYFFPQGSSSRQIIGAMVKRFWNQFPDEWRSRAKELNLTIHEVVTLASIIEKETGDASERPLIASVFHNRLKRGMRLESDPTVIYGIKDFDGNIKKKHLLAYTPYNTYKIRGLPPGPIASPGAKAIEATLFPAETNYLYFVSKKDTTHHFSTNIKDHNRAVRKYQLRRKRKQ